MTATHVPVLLDRCVDLLAPAIARPGAVLVDATVGMGGHAATFLTRFPSLRLIGCDRDQDALALARDRLARFGDRVRLVHTVYDRIAEAVRDVAQTEADGILFDLGVSSMQIDTAERGFSYTKDAPLDMRMDRSQALTAERILATYSEAQLRRIFIDYGEEKFGARYARRIVDARRQMPLVRTSQLVAAIDEATPAGRKRSGHSAKRVFQALRIEVNQELAVLERAIPAAIDLLAIGGRIVVLSFHSLEDRIVKRAMQRAATSTAPEGLPVELAEHAPELTLLTRGSEQASAGERAGNPRAASVRLRAAERIRRRV